MKTPVISGTIVTKRFEYRIAPHEILKEEYPQDYYKFYDHRVAWAFFQETLGHEVKPQHLHHVEAIQ